MIFMINDGPVAGSFSLIPYPLTPFLLPIPPGGASLLAPLLAQPRREVLRFT